jgi:serine/threonine protein kinase
MSSLSPADALQVEALCNRFEAAWKARPPIEPYLGDAAEPARPVLLAELLQLDLAYRRRAGETPVASDYLPRFPEYVSLIAALLPASDGPGSLPERRTVGEAGGTGKEAPGRWVAADAQRSAPSEGPGTRLGPYKLLQKLGEGGMGTVFLAEQEQPVRRRVALKVIKAGLDSAHVMARFEAERQALALMDHTNIAKVLDAGATESGRPYFVMELVKGVPLTKYCDQEHLTPRERLELFVPVCQAVQHAHQKGVIHRDLKPSNILVALYDGQPAPKVIDFGVAKATAQRLTEKTMVTEVGQIVGTLEYMAPEQAELNNLDIDTRADVYALGAILYELLTGSTPFTRQQLRSAAFTEVLRLIREVEPPKPSTRLSNSAELPAIAGQRQLEPRRLTRQVQGELDWIVMKCLEKERGRRYETANALAMDLQRYLTDEPVLASPPSAAYRVRKFLRRHRGPMVAAALVLLALLTGMAGTIVGLDLEARRQRDAAEAARNEAEAARNEESLQRQQAVAEKDRAEAAEALAKGEAAITGAVNEFLQKDLLGQADLENQPQPGGAAERSANITVRELLDRAAKAVEGKFAEQPRTEAAVRLMLGDRYRALGRYAEALPHLERSVQLRSAQLGADHPDTLTSKHSLAELYRAQGKYDRAEPLLQQVLAGRLARLGANHPDTLACKNDLAVLYFAQRKYDRAEPLLQDVLASRTAQLGADHLDTLQSKNNLATLFRIQGKYDRAEPLFQEALAGYTAQLGPDHPDTLTTKQNLAALDQAQRKYDRAEPLLKEVLDTRTARLGADHPDTLLSKLKLAQLYQAQRKYDQAEPLFLQVLDGFTAKLGGDHPETLGSKNNLAGLYKAQGKYDRAEPLYREAAEGARKKLGLSHPSTQLFIRNLVECYEKMGQKDKADEWRKQLEQAKAAAKPPAQP